MVPLLISVLLHPFHATQAEAQWNAETQRLEVSLQLQSLDVNRILKKLADERTKQGDHSITLDDQAKQKIIANYIQTNFRLESSPKEFGELHWVGWETKGALYWVYFELSPPKKTTWQLRNTLLFEFEHDQTNIDSFLHDKRVSLTFNSRRMLYPLAESDLGIEKP